MKKNRGFIDIRFNQRLKNTGSGAPNWAIWATVNDSPLLAGRTAYNSQAAYRYNKEEYIEADYHFTASGALIIDYIYK